MVISYLNFCNRNSLVKSPQMVQNVTAHFVRDQPKRAHVSLSIILLHGMPKPKWNYRCCLQRYYTQLSKFRLMLLIDLCITLKNIIRGRHRCLQVSLNQDCFHFWWWDELPNALRAGMHWLSRISWSPSLMRTPPLVTLIIPWHA